MRREGAVPFNRTPTAFGQPPALKGSARTRHIPKLRRIRSVTVCRRTGLKHAYLRNVRRSAVSSIAAFVLKLALRKLRRLVV